MTIIDGKLITNRDIGRAVYAVTKQGTTFGALSRVSSDFVFILCFDQEERAFDPRTVHWGERPESQYKRRRTRAVPWKERRHTRGHY